MSKCLLFDGISKFSKLFTPEEFESGCFNEIVNRVYKTIKEKLDRVQPEELQRLFYEGAYIQGVPVYTHINDTTANLYYTNDTTT